MVSFFHDLFVAPLQFSFMVRSLLAIIFICLSCGIVSTFLILKGWSLYGDALSHAVLPGIVIALAFDFNVAIGIFAISLVVTFVINYFKQVTPFTEQTTLAYVTSSFMGLGFLLYYLHPLGIRINEILFGKIVGLTTANVIGLGIITAVILLVVGITWRTLALIFFDRVFARVIGLRVRIFEYVFYVLIAITVMSSLRSVGTLLVVSLLIVPGALAYLLTTSLARMMLISAIFSCLTGMLGLFVAYHYSLSTGAVIIAIQFTCFLLLFFTQYAKRKFHLVRKAQALKANSPAGAENNHQANSISVSQSSPVNNVQMQESNTQNTNSRKGGRQ